MAVKDATPKEERRLTTEVAELFPLQREWTEADYFALPETNRLIELSERELIMPPHPNYSHQQTVGRLYRSFCSFVEPRDLGVVQLAPLPVRLWPGKIREPDVLFISKTHADRIGEKFCGPPDLAVEVISPSTRETDHVTKLWEYAQAGVSEYWQADPESKIIEVYVLRNDVYELWQKAGPREKVRSQATGRLRAGTGRRIRQVANQPQNRRDCWMPWQLGGERG